MRVVALFLTLFACALWGCTPFGNQQLAPAAMATADPGCGEACSFGGNTLPSREHIGSIDAPVREQSGYLNVNKSQHSGYVYVSDGKAQALEVYRFGFAGAPIRTVPLDGPGFAVCTDARGRVYVTEQLNSEVQVFDSGAVNALGKLQGVYEPDGCTAANGNVYIANHPTNGSNHGFVSVYQAGNLQASLVIASAAAFAPLGVAVDAQGDVFESAIGQVGRGTGGVFLEYTPGTSGSDYRLLALLCECADRGGIAMDGRGNVTVGDIGRLTTFFAPDFKQSRSQNPPQPGILEFFTRNDFGLVVPMNDGDGKSTVTVYPARGGEAPYVLREGMETPQGAAGGI